MADPVVGPADPATVHRLLEEKMRANAKGDRTYQKADPTPPPQPQGVPITGKDRLDATDQIIERMKNGEHHG